MKPDIIFIVGPTSSGKSAVAAELAVKIGGEVISCDSMQVYKDMDIITQAPDETLMNRVKHHLVKEVSPEKNFSAAQFAERAEYLIEDIVLRKKFPIFVGGTGLYVKALVDGLFDSPAKNEDFRKRMEREAEEKGEEYLHEKLRALDPRTADILHPNDIRRIVRALEVLEFTGETISDKKSEAEGIARKYKCEFYGLKLPREVLYARINKRVDVMFEEGLVDEVKRLSLKGIGETASKALGVKEIMSFLSGNNDIEKAKEDLKKNTRRYAKRQMTWWGGDDRIVWIKADRSTSDIVGDILERSAER
ncbi:MAG: tRNA (adenosine(37)-N6)-dimethylallyltransferase MiaA [Candidatus Omnitrophica bacterium]|nr:tRNA (adenosine(37)-N6)-dimethylallyltransferase MiaA [Candidatus Omnitrophota bacterium]